MTTRCISIAQKPGNFGTTFHNKGYQLLGLDFEYVACKVMPEELGATIQMIRDQSIRGASVTMPHKQAVMEYLDSIDPLAERIRAVNTIVNENGILRGYNTDYIGAKTAIEQHVALDGKNVVLLGAGGAARAVAYALHDLGAQLTLINRDSQKAHELAKEFGKSAKVVAYEDLSNASGYLFVNATSIGMNSDVLPIPVDSLQNYEAIMDVVAYPPVTSLIIEAKKLGKTVISGLEMIVYQGAAQFKLYTGLNAPKELIERSLVSIQ